MIKMKYKYKQLIATGIFLLILLISISSVKGFSYVEEEDGTFTVIYTALMKNDNNRFYAVGKCTLALEK